MKVAKSDVAIPGDLGEEPEDDTVSVGRKELGSNVMS